MPSDRRSSPRSAPPLLTLEAPQNAPPGGAYLLALYPGQDGPHQVDWYWQPRSTASVPSNVEVLFDRVALPPLPESAPPTAEDLARIASEKVAAFWVAALIAGKGIARGRPWDASALLSWARASLADVRSFLDPGTSPGGDASRRDQDPISPPPGARPEARLAALRAMCEEMDALAPAVVALGGHVPAEATRQVARFLDLVGSTIEPGRRSGTTAALDAPSAAGRARSQARPATTRTSR